MDPRFLRTFATVVRLASFSGAARELGYTQSAVSQHVAALEGELGTRLLERRPVAPTEAGTRLLEHAGPILLRLDAARADVMRVAGDPTGRLTVGATPLSAGRAARAVAAARAHGPSWPRPCACWRATRSWKAWRRARSTPGSWTPRPRRTTRCGCPRPGFPSPRSPRSRWRWRWRPDIRSAGAPACGSRTSSTPAGSTRRRRRRRWPSWPRSPGPTASGRALRYDGLDVGGLCALVAAGQGLALLPARAAADGVPLAAPQLVHRTELLAAGSAPPLRLD